MEMWIASSNRGKIAEFQMLLKEIPDLVLHVQSEISAFSPPKEDGTSFLANARIKARSLKSVKNNVWVLAEDSGLEAEGLNNLPGIHSARYAGEKAGDAENVAKLLKMISMRTQNRKARFYTSLVIYNPQGEEFSFEGDLKGQIAMKPAGQHGFGYDPVFIPEGETQTLAELGPGFKNMKSHRSVAIKKFVEAFKQGTVK